MSEQKLLLVDDEEAILKLVGKSFERAGYTVRMATSGEAALTVLQEEEIHVLFLDLNMPGMSGIELCRRVKRERPMALVYALTGYAGLFELAECREAGFDDYFMKPADMNLLRSAAQTAFDKLERWKRG